MGSEIQKPDHLKSSQMAAILSKSSEIWTKSLDFELPGFQMGRDYIYFFAHFLFILNFGFLISPWDHIYSFLSL